MLPSSLGMASQIAARPGTSALGKTSIRQRWYSKSTGYARTVGYLYFSDACAGIMMY